MKISLKNFGALKQAEFTLGDMTIICGGNNTGKTYATYALYGFLSFWRNSILFPAQREDVKKLLTDGTVSFSIQPYLEIASERLKIGCEVFTKHLPQVFASSEKNFKDSQFSCTLELEDPVSSFERTIGAPKTHLFSILKKENSPIITVSLLIGKDEVKVSEDVICQIIGDMLREIIFGHVFPRAFIASAERTGAAIFRKELNFARNRILEELSAQSKEVKPYELLTKAYSDYALPVKANVDFTRKLEESAKKESFILKEHPETLTDFSSIIGGRYEVTRNDELYFIPKGNGVKLTMDESSSAVRSLLDVGFYLRHVAEKDDILMIDEPELNLHPENQRLVARLLARIVNLGIKVFITTHSDYIVKELNTLITLNQGTPRLKKLAEREGYKKDELLDAKKIKVYIAEKAAVKLDGSTRKSACQTLVPANVEQQTGIDAPSFERTIEEMNRIQGEIIWGEDVHEEQTPIEK